VQGEAAVAVDLLTDYPDLSLFRGVDR
jgi:hypothetical protein